MGQGPRGGGGGLAGEALAGRCLPPDLGQLSSGLPSSPAPSLVVGLAHLHRGTSPPPTQAKISQQPVTLRTPTERQRK